MRPDDAVNIVAGEFPPNWVLDFTTHTINNTMYKEGVVLLTPSGQEKVQDQKYVNKSD